MKQNPIEHKFVAHCLAYLLGNLKDTKVISVSAKPEAETLQIVRKDLKRLYKKSSSKIDAIIDQIKPVINKAGGHDIKVGLWGSGIKLVVEVKGEDPSKEKSYVYARYTVLGQLINSFKKFARHEWYGLACPASWKEHLHSGLMDNPIIDMVIRECRKRDQRMFFYFIHKNGRVEQYQWGNFFRQKIV